MLQNLLSNALKFTRKGNVKVSGQVNKKGAALDQLELEVRVVDSGIGMSANTMSKVFEGKFIK